MDDNAPITDPVTIWFAGRKYTGRRLTADQVSAIRSVRDDGALMLDLFEDMATYAFGEDGFREHLRARARGAATVEGFIKLMVKFMEASAKTDESEPEPEHAAAPDVPDTFKAHA